MVVATRAAKGRSMSAPSSGWSPNALAAISSAGHAERHGQRHGACAPTRPASSAPAPVHRSRANRTTESA